MVNKFCKFAMFMLCINSICGCNKKVDVTMELSNESYISSEYSEYLVPLDYDLKKAANSGFVLYKDEDIKNEEKIDEFYQKSKNNKNCYLNIVRYTVEGDPIIYSYIYLDGEYILCVDNRRDNYNSDNKIIVTKIKRIEISKDVLGRKIIIEKY